MQHDGRDVRPEPLEERRTRLAKLLSRSNKAMRDGIQLSQAITGDGARVSARIFVQLGVCLGWFPASLTGVTSVRN
jgi:ATP-dependent DNA ligase